MRTTPSVDRYRWGLPHWATTEDEDDPDDLDQPEVDRRRGNQRVGWVPRTLGGRRGALLLLTTPFIEPVKTHVAAAAAKEESS